MDTVLLFAVSSILGEESADAGSMLPGFLFVTALRSVPASLWGIAGDSESIMSNQLPIEGGFSMLAYLQRCLKDERGQGMTEYILIVVLIAIAAIVAFTYFRDQLNTKVNSSADEVFSKT